MRKRFSFFRIDSGFIGYPTDIVEAATQLEPEEAIERIDSGSGSFDTTNLEVVGGGIFVPNIRLLEKNENILVAEVLPQDFVEYIGKYQPIIGQVKEEYVEHMSNTVSQKLQEALVGEHQQWNAYVSMSSLIFGFTLDPIVDEFLDHAHDEYEHILALGRILVNAGVRPTTKRVDFQDATDTSGIIKVNLDLEEKAVKQYQDIVKTINDEASPALIEVQNFLSKEAEHAQDLRKLLRYI